MTIEEFRKDKFGVFIHWGLYSELGGYWKGDYYPNGSEWIMRNAKIPFEEYKKLMYDFYPSSFDADTWVREVADCGAKYLVFTAKHHDGFCMFRTDVSDYSICNTEYGRDILAELSSACKKYGIKLGIYYSQMQDWSDPDADGNTWDFSGVKNFDRYFEQKVKVQIKELLSNYGDISLLWFDTPYDMPKEKCKELLEWVKSIQENCLINGRIGYRLGDYRQMGDNSIPLLPLDEPWETPATLNNTWGYSLSDRNWKSSQTILHQLLQTVSKGGNYLINIGPDASGTFPQEGQFVLRKIGEWLRLNGESVFNTEVVPLFPYQFDWGTFTKRGNYLYMHILKYPTDRADITVIGLCSQVKSVELLESRIAVPFKQFYEIARDEQRFTVTVPSETPCVLDTVLKIEIEGSLLIQKI